ncbi:IclR family transcriptional regulator [Gordonia insulae]|uniref:DNA-binding transcriptional repressor YiaJ n=1 Tax=Gordonia insulae TaxID=2420509 RepID=A0A3G8JLA9_9ACTN|nr:IclR family transcriptional regulator [Gordonia insulae]AZG45864.1 DNA-binding transcriptional repressor YiaJ [Gordonia insulae]
MSSSLMQPVSIAPIAPPLEPAVSVRKALASTEESESSDRRSPDRTVLGRVAAIMDAFNCSQQVLGLGDLSERTGLPKSTLHRLADQLCQIGWVERERGGYRVGLRMFELGGLATEASRLRELALPHLQALSARTGMPVHLGVFDNGEIVDLERVMAGPVRTPVRRGGRFPVHCSALGKAIAAFDGEVARFAVDGRHEASRSGSGAAAMRAELETIRRLGVAFDRGESFEGWACAAAPIRGAGEVIGAVSVSGQLGRLRLGAVAEAVDHTATAIWNASNRHAAVRRR